MARASEKQLLPLLGILAVMGVGAVITILSLNTGQNTIGLAGAIPNTAGAEDYFTDDIVITLTRDVDASVHDSFSVFISSSKSEFYYYKTYCVWNNNDWTCQEFANTDMRDWYEGSQSYENINVPLQNGVGYFAVFTCREHHKSIIDHPKITTSAERNAMTAYFNGADYTYICGYEPTSTNKYMNWRIIQVGPN